MEGPGGPWADLKCSESRRELAVGRATAVEGDGTALRDKTSNYPALESLVHGGHERTEKLDGQHTGWNLGSGSRAR
jgi:hypothetical protein